jgi:hypothetical protein
MVHVFNMSQVIAHVSNQTQNDITKKSHHLCPFIVLDHKAPTLPFVQVERVQKLLAQRPLFWFPPQQLLPQLLQSQKA